MNCVWVHVFGASDRASQQEKDPWSGLEWEMGCGQGVQKDRGAVPVLRDVCVPSLVTCFHQPKRRNQGNWTLCVYINYMSYMLVLLKTIPCPCHSVAGHVTVPCMCLWATCAPLRLVTSPLGKEAAKSCHPGRGSPGLDGLEQAAALLTSCEYSWDYMYINFMRVWRLIPC